jgi:hypothetical protein
MEKHLLPDYVVAQWRPVKDEEIPTPHTNDIVMLMSFFQRGVGLPSCEFLCGLLHHYQIELVHINPNSILQIAIFVHLCKCYLTIHPNFPLFKHYFFLKYQPSAAKRKVIGGVDIQSRPHCNFLDLPLKTSLKGCHKSCFYYENHESSLPPFVGHLTEYNGTWIEEPTLSEMPLVSALAGRISGLKELDLTGVNMAANWLVHRVTSLKK